MDDKDYLRFIHDLFEFNDQEPADNIKYKFKNIDIASPYIRRARKLLVDIHAFCLMPNHYHLLLSPRIDGGIVKFMKKLNIGYAKYFNERYERSGALFQGRYKSVKVENESHFRYLPYYIHLNPLDLTAPEWREGKINDYDKAIKFLNKYRWSSFIDYDGKTNFPSVTSRKFISEVFDHKISKNIKEFLQDLNAEVLRGVILEDF